MAKHGKKPKRKTKAKKTSTQNPGGGKKKGSGGASSKPKGGKKAAPRARKYLTVADLKRQLERISNSLATLNAYFSKFPEPTGRVAPSGDVYIGPQVIGDQCAPATDGPGIGTPVVVGDQCAPADTQATGGTNWYVFKRTLARMKVTVDTLIGMLGGMDTKTRI